MHTKQKRMRSQQRKIAVVIFLHFEHMQQVFFTSNPEKKKEKFRNNNHKTDTCKCASLPLCVDRMCQCTFVCARVHRIGTHLS